MADLPIYQVDAFTGRLFAGNPAAVVLLDHFLDDALLRDIAAENNLAETAFLVPHEGQYRLRWFTPTVEVPLCGHATLASAAVVMERLEPGRTELVFESASGPLHVKRSGTGYVMNFPARAPVPVTPPPILAEALGMVPVETLDDGANFIAVLPDAATVRGLAPDLNAIMGLARVGLVVTAPGDAPHDFVSRYFAPAKGIPEDPVTGSAHCGLAPYWAGRLDKTSFRALQVSRRGGELLCRLDGGRVELEGSCVFYLEGRITIQSPSSTEQAC
jgi:PhzF family phenazine biosynthesis protein